MPRVLAIDRETEVLEAIAASLTDGGYELTTARSVDEALLQLQHGNYECVLVDEELEAASGGRFSAELSRYPSQTVSLIVLSSGSTVSRLAALRRGAFDCLAKPFDRDLVRVMVARAVERTTLARTLLSLLDEVDAANAELRAAREHLRSRVDEATRSLRTKVEELDAARRQLERAQRERTEFIHVIAHELGGPLTAIEGYAELLTNAEIPAELHRRASTVIRSELRRFARLVQDLTGTAHSPLELSLIMAEHDMIELVREQVEVAYALAGAHSVLVKMPDDDLPVRCDRDRIGQVIFNLLSNAVKYSNGREIRVCLTTHPGAVELRIANDGPCIPRDRLEAIFEPRVRLAGTATRQIAGRGLGLYVARQIAQAHGGSLRAMSGRGGTEFTLCLPLAACREADEWQANPSLEGTRACAHSGRVPRRARGLQQQ